MGVQEPVRFGRREVGAFWQAVHAMDDAAAHIERVCANAAWQAPGRRAGVEEVSSSVVRLRRSLAEVLDLARAAGVPPEDADRVDVSSQRWVTAVHEAAHAVVGGHLGHRVEFAGVTSATTGLTRTGRDASGLEEAVIAVAGQVGARALLGQEGGAGRDYARAEAALNGTGWSLGKAESLAEDIVHSHRGELIALARRIYQHSRENNIH